MTKEYVRSLKERGRCASCANPVNSEPLTICARCKERIAANDKRRRDKCKALVFMYYGNRCACCGISGKTFLTIDHINNDGAEHRKIIGNDIYKWLVRHGFPDGFQLMCWNCNESKQLNGGHCEHQ